MVVDQSIEPLIDLDAPVEEELNERQKSVLKGVCDSFIYSGVPVGSRTISKFEGFACSPATIRNEMADLESLGFLFSPHTSSGRVPTIKGYRFYVNFLLKFEKLNQMEESLIGLLAKKYEEQISEPEKILKEAVRLACDFTKLGGMVLAPQKKQKGLRSVQLIRLLEDRVMLVMVDDCGKITDELLPISPDVTDNDLQKINNFLNNEITNSKILENEKKLIEKSHSILKKHNSLLSALVERMLFALNNPGEDAIFLEGFVNFFEQAEFKDPEKMKKMISLLDQKEKLLKLLAKSLETGKDIMVNIGTAANLGLPISDLSMVTARYRGPNQSLGRIGLIGPLRMNYAKVISTLANISKALSTLFVGQEG